MIRRLKCKVCHKVWSQDIYLLVCDDPHDPESYVDLEDADGWWIWSYIPGFCSEHNKLKREDQSCAKSQ